jgi:hypothetical protein
VVNRWTLAVALGDNVGNGAIDGDELAVVLLGNVETTGGLRLS